MVQKILFKWKLYCILKNDLAFHQVKEELWNLGNMLLGVLQSLEYFFSFKISGNEANNPTFALSLRSSLSFSKICFFNMFILVFFDHYLQIHKMFASERFWDSQMWNIVTHIWGIIIAYQIYKVKFLDVAITLVGENWQLASKR